MESEILDALSYGKTINKQKVTINRIVKCLRNKCDVSSWDEYSVKASLLDLLTKVMIDD